MERAIFARHYTHIAVNRVKTSSLPFSTMCLVARCSFVFDDLVDVDVVGAFSRSTPERSPVTNVRQGVLHA